MALTKSQKIVTYIGALVSVAGLTYNIYQGLHDNSTKSEEAYTKIVKDYEANVRSIKLDNKKKATSKDSILLANLTSQKLRFTLKYNTFDGNWLVEGSVPFAKNEVNYIDSYTKNRQIYISCQDDKLRYYNNELSVDTTKVMVTKQIPYLFLVGAKNPYKNTYELKLVGADLDEHNNLIVTDRKLSKSQFQAKIDSVNSLK